ncbi:hypothetical protein SAMN05192561_102100 [Halopenitus malekzadehii]|uniref:DUF7345 domain-containing protein n=1 Tax=Halopenitus malekzadehii TaxID=1267564 RepID=A0A1H6IDP3_9EURY|nr:hypothetical protein [Halopenitus malekzadehii]SEH45979.1 hypothetical protein SAMN05192561_102100 [Halopenitus malekzadehii]
MTDTWTATSGSRTRLRGGILALLVVCSLLVGASGPAAAADHTGSESAFIVDLEDDGDATVTLRLTYDLDDDAERSAFASLRNDSTTRADLRDRFASRMRSVANDTAATVERDQSIDASSIDITTTSGTNADATAADGDTNGTGVAALSVRWAGLAATNEGTLTLTEPFASGFTTDHRFVVTGPDGYAATAVTPDGSTVENETYVWDGGTNLEGFEMVLEPTDGSDADTTADEVTDDDATVGSAPGFGTGAAVAALAALTVVLRARRARDQK